MKNKSIRKHSFFQEKEERTSNRLLYDKQIAKKKAKSSGIAPALTVIIRKSVTEVIQPLLQDLLIYVMLKVC